LARKRAIAILSLADRRAGSAHEEKVRVQSGMRLRQLCGPGFFQVAHGSKAECESRGMASALVGAGRLKRDNEDWNRAMAPSMRWISSNAGAGLLRQKIFSKNLLQ